MDKAKFDRLASMTASCGAGVAIGAFFLNGGTKYKTLLYVGLGTLTISLIANYFSNNRIFQLLRQIQLFRG